MKTPETSKNFVKHVDKTTKIVSYFLKPGLMDDTQQSWYFTAKSMTDDGRFLLFWTCPNEKKPQQGKPAPKKTAAPKRAAVKKTQPQRRGGGKRV